jgi:P27 family predicted phage terminase small subunit
MANSAGGKNGKGRGRPASNLPKAPKKLSREAKAWWGKIVSEWDLDDPALLLLESALEAFDRMREAQQMIAEDGAVIEDRFGQKKAHPATLIERDSKGTLLRTLRALNLDIEPLNDRPGRPAGSTRGK